MSPWPGAYVDHHQGPIKIHGTRLHSEDGEPGTVVALTQEGPAVACGQGSVIITRIQRPGRRAVSGADFLLGSSLKVGQSLSESI